MTRRRAPGYYVSVHVESLGTPADLLDGPWPSVERAEMRVRELRETGVAAAVVVKVARDGVTIEAITPG